MIASLTDRAFLGWEQAGTAFRRLKTVVTGNPIRPAMASVANQPRAQRRDNLRRILVTGGPVGEPFLNENVPCYWRPFAIWASLWSSITRPLSGGLRDHPPPGLPSLNWLCSVCRLC
jgi:hypothetical protein